MKQISGVSLAVFKQQRSLTVEDDGYVGQLTSGYAMLEATVAPQVPIYGFIRQGNDNYALQKDQTDLSKLREGTYTHKSRKEWLAERNPPSGSRIYRIKMEIGVNHKNISFCGYPNNMLCLAKLVQEQGKPTNEVRVWKVALMAQNGEFFLTTQKAYETTAYTDSNVVRFPRFEAHPKLEELLVGLLPSGISLPLLSEYQDDRRQPTVRLRKNEALVLGYYHARGIGTVLTQQGVARVHWSDIPPRPRYRYLVPGERLQFKELGTPRASSATPTRSARETTFERQVYGLTLTEQEEAA